VTDSATPSRTSAVVVIIMVVAAVLAGSLLYLASSKPPVPPSPTTLLPEVGRQVTPGSFGCRPIPGNVCVSEQFTALVRGLDAANLSFAVTNPIIPTYPIRGDLNLGSGASVALFQGAPNGTGGWNASGVWNYSLGSWSLRPTGNLSSPSPFTLVLDTGLTSDETLENATFWVELPPPNQVIDGLELGGL
jgi:hypothetical protein